MFSLHGLCDNACLLIFPCFTAFNTIRHVQLLIPPCITGNLLYQNFDKFKTIVLWISATVTKRKSKLILLCRPILYINDYYFLIYFV